MLDVNKTFGMWLTRTEGGTKPFVRPTLTGWVCSVKTCRAFVGIGTPKPPA